MTTRHTTCRTTRRTARPARYALACCLGALVALAACGSMPTAGKPLRSDRPTPRTSTNSTAGGTTTTAPSGTAATGPSGPSTTAGGGASSTTPTLAAPAPGFVVGHVTAVGDSVMLDYQAALERDIPGVDVEADVSRQWSTGESILAQLRAEGQLGAVVVVGLGTNGPISDADFDSMMSVLSGASRVVFVNIVVDQDWQDPNNAVLSRGVARYPNTVLADWAGLEAQHPDWVYAGDGTHLPIDGTGAQALAALVASKV